MGARLGKLFCLSVLASVSGVAVAQSVLTRDLSKPNATLGRSFQRITSVVELPNGTVVVVDANAQAVWLVDFSTASARQLGRKGAGPAEYLHPRRLFRLGGDSVGIDDRGNRRILVVTPEGRLGGVLDAWGGRILGRRPVPGEPPTVSDGKGRLYALGFSFLAPESAQPADSAPIERWSLGSYARDTIAYLPLPPIRLRTEKPGEPSRALVMTPQWTVGWDGRVAIVHANPYVVHQIEATGHPVAGRPMTYKRLPVTAADKRRWREEQARPYPVLIVAPRAPAPSVGLRTRPLTEPVQWPAYLPPFREDAALYSPAGFLSIHRTGPIGARESFDIIDRFGGRVGTVTAPSHTRLVGFGRSHAYLVRIDEDHQEFLERYSIDQTGW